MSKLGTMLAEIAVEKNRSVRLVKATETKARVKALMLELVGKDEKPSIVFVPKERGLGEALDADARNNLRAELRKKIGEL